MRYSSRFFLYAPLGLFLLLAAGVCLHWGLAASAFAAKLDAVNGHEVMPGVTMTFAARRTTGFPFSLDTELRGLTLSVATPQGPTRWHTAEFAMHSLTYGRDETIFEAAGPQTLSWNGEDGKRRSLSFAVGSLRASAILRKGALARFDFDLVGFGSKEFTARRLQFHLRRAGRLDLYVETEALQAPDCPGLPASRRLTGTLTTATALAPLLVGDTDWQSAIAAWRAAGGRTDFKGTAFAIPAEQLVAVTGFRALCH
jgi:hypothetical protein